ncbi:MAG: hypothetical protein NC417_00265 [Candidatus Gastranaerophilales bacterium]|nr:hypothetical protein [Candidatus Gastranaerophilales bacterium]
MENTIIFKIEIKKENGGFSQASNFISKLREYQNLDRMEVKGITNVLYDNKNITSRSAAEYVLQHLNDFKSITKPDNLNVVKDYNIYFCLWIEENSLEDIIDLQYDCLMKKFFDKEKIFTILSGEESIYFKASHFLYGISCCQENLYNNFFYKKSQGGGIIRLQKNRMGNLMDFMPFQYFSREEKGFLDNVETVISKSMIQQALMGRDVGDESVFPVLGGGLKLLNSAQKCVSEEMAERFSEILCRGNIFTFLLFVYSFSYKAFWRNSTYEDVDQCYFAVRERAAGCEQLIENVISHSTAGFGGVAIRMHEADSQYLRSRYELERPSGRYVEILITDYAGVNTSGNMADNFRKDMSESDRRELEELEPIDFLVDAERQDVRGTQVQSALKKYNCNSENIGKHIGLKIFRKVVEENDGIFGFYSHRTHVKGKGENYRFSEYSSALCMPGTGYTVLFPVRKRKEEIHRAEIGIDYNIELEENIKEYIKGYDCIEAKLDAKRLEFDSQEQKEAMIAELARELSGDRYSAEKQRRIKYISVEKMPDRSAEYIAKALLISSYDKEIADYVFYNCTGEFVSVFQQTMSVYFGMSDLAHFYEHREFVIALYTKTPIECCFIIPGHYKKTIWANQANCYSGSEYMGVGWLSAYKDQYEDQKLNEGGIPPYDILYEAPSDRLKCTIFEQYTLQILETDIQEQKFGCKINNTHMRLGSTIHIDSFYEAELLFSNRLFFSRFAYLLSKKILVEDPFKQAKQVTLYSYALYSEMLIVETVNILSLLCPDKDIDYAILERESDHRDFSHVDRIRYSRSFAPDEQEWEDEEGEKGAEKRKEQEKEERKNYFQNRKIICIVPINSTLKTHEKLLTLFCEDNGKDCAQNIILSYAMILVGSQKENQYWEISETEKTFNKINLDIKPIPHYFLAVKVDYYEAIDCKLCFPENSLDEIPLVEVNAASTIPNQSFGLYDKESGDVFTYDRIKDEEEKLSVLRGTLVYSHTQRGENHFLYYFKTDELFLKQKQSIEAWLRNEVPKIHINANEYHILFCPSHYSNAGFLESINRLVFHEAALVIRADVDKEYRSNICAKYSNLAVLVRLLEQDESKIIKIYYVDDSIITGRTYFRAKSLISSVVERYNKNRKRKDIHIFEKVYVLLDRNSKQSRLQYIGCWDSRNKSEDQLSDSFLAYRTLHVSSMRNHGDSCILCRLERESKTLYLSSATKRMAEYWKDQHEKFKVKHLRDKQEESEIVKSPEKAFRRMFCCHMATMALSGEQHGNRKESAIQCLLSLLSTDYEGRKKVQGQSTAFEYFMSYLKVISRPFLVFDKAVKEAVFDVQLVLAEGLLGQKTISILLKGTKKQYLKRCRKAFSVVLEQMIQKEFTSKQKLDLLQLLIKQLTEMKGNYFIRVENIRKLSDFASGYTEDERERLYLRFLQQTKKLLGVSSDTSKSAWFSHEICGKENISGLPEHILGRLLLENTRAYYDGLEKLCRKSLDFPLDDELRKNAYRDFVSVLSDINLYDKQKNSITENGRKEVMAGVELLNQCRHYATTRGSELSDKKIEGICHEIVNLMKTILDARKVELLLECPMECDKWEDDLREQYNRLVETHLGEDGKELKMQLQKRKEYLTIAGSEKTKDFIFIEGAEIDIAQKMQKYHNVRNKQKIKGLYIDGDEKYVIWEIGNAKPQWEEQRQLLVYVEFDQINFPEIWHRLRNLLCMNNCLNESVFNEEGIDYLFELILADKKSMLSELERTHSHTALSVRTAHYERVLNHDAEKSKEYRSYVLTLLSDLHVSQVYRSSLKEDYYCRWAGVTFRECDKVFSAFRDESSFIIVDREETTKRIELYVKMDDEDMLAKEQILSFGEAYGVSEVFLLLFALIINAAGPNRGVKEKDMNGGMDRITVCLKKTSDGYLRIENEVSKPQNKVSKLESEVSELENRDSAPEKTLKEINAEQLYPPRRERGISLWSVSRYIRSMISSMLEKKLRDAAGQLDDLPDMQCKKNKLIQLKSMIEKMTSEEYYIRVSKEEGGAGKTYFCVDIPILAKRYEGFEEQ